jgi:YggT family protein
VSGLERILCLALLVFWILLLARVLISLLQAFGGMRPPLGGPLRSAYDGLFAVTEPPLRLLRSVVPPVGRIDISVLVAFVLINVLQIAIC